MQAKLNNFLISRRLLLIIVVFNILSLLSCNKSSDFVDISTAPDFKLKTLDQKTISLSDLRGKVVLINFWATWCGPCRMEVPHLKTLYSTFDRKQFEILALSDETPDKIVRFVDSYDLPYPIVLANRETLLSYNIRAFPTAFLIDKKGLIQYKWEGLRSPQAFERAIKQLIND